MCSLTRMHAQDKFCDPTVYSEHYCSVGSFGAKFLCIFLFILKYVNFIWMNLS